MNEVIEFIKKNKSFYPEYFENDRLNKCKYGYTCEVDQIYSYLNKIDIKETGYYVFYNIVKNNFNLNQKNILEVGCGYIPILSSLFSNEYNITAVNDKILIKNYKNVITKEKDLLKNYNISKYDLIIGYRSCIITENIIDLCNKYNKEFIFYFCPCIHESRNGEKFETYEEWINYIINKIKSFNKYQIMVLHNDNLPDKCPIIIGKLTQ